MTAQGEGILAWLDRAITVREQAAREAARFYGPRWVRPVDTDVVRVSDDGVVWFQALSDEIAEHIIYNSPETVLRRCAADRKLLKEHAPQQDGSGFPDSMQCRTCSQSGGDGYQYLVPFPCVTVRALAEGYGWTGGER
ncbi:hypothetical protein IQ62_01510 [Streptomyces scabiei]|uniref:DUF6221 family protein n=1 Tax=Streptomyces scabiei TaxID=1930 RepID=UPI0004E634C6|nr:DUF6221 family protein [Streptomyces scabiei]KFG02521.1 hypothetical protein IQ62_01510 [Streptomyces scabiei]